jgi:hypothetical protein
MMKWVKGHEHHPLVQRCRARQKPQGHLTASDIHRWLRGGLRWTEWTCMWCHTCFSKDEPTVPWFIVTKRHPNGGVDVDRITCSPECALAADVEASPREHVRRIAFTRQWWKDVWPSAEPAACIPAPDPTTRDTYCAGTLDKETWLRSIRRGAPKDVWATPFHPVRHLMRQRQFTLASTVEEKNVEWPWARDEEDPEETAGVRVFKDTHATQAWLDKHVGEAPEGYEWVPSAKTVVQADPMRMEGFEETASTSLKLKGKWDVGEWTAGRYRVPEDGSWTVTCPCCHTPLPPGRWLFPVVFRVRPMVDHTRGKMVLWDVACCPQHAITLAYTSVPKLYRPEAVSCTRQLMHQVFQIPMHRPEMQRAPPIHCADTYPEGNIPRAAWNAIESEAMPSLDAIQKEMKVSPYLCAGWAPSKAHAPWVDLRERLRQFMEGRLDVDDVDTPKEYDFACLEAEWTDTRAVIRYAWNPTFAGVDDATHPVESDAREMLKTAAGRSRGDDVDLSREDVTEDDAAESKAGEEDADAILKHIQRGRVDMETEKTWLRLNSKLVPKPQSITGSQLESRGMRASQRLEAGTDVTGRNYDDPYLSGSVMTEIHKFDQKATMRNRQERVLGDMPDLPSAAVASAQMSNTQEGVQNQQKIVRDAMDAYAMPVRPSATTTGARHAMGYALRGRTSFMGRLSRVTLSSTSDATPTSPAPTLRAPESLEGEGMVRATSTSSMGEDEAWAALQGAMDQDAERMDATKKDTTKDADA